MHRLSSFIKFTFLTLFFLTCSTLFAGTGPDARTLEILAQHYGIKGDFVVIEYRHFDDNAESVAQEVLPYDEYLTLYYIERDQKPNPATRQDDYEGIVPTPAPPNPLGFNQGDTATFFRSGFFNGSRFNRTTTYTYLGNGDSWGMNSNTVEETPCDGNAGCPEPTID